MAKAIKLFMCILASALSATATAQQGESKLTSVAARDITLQVPESWKPVKVVSSSRLLQYEIPNTEADGESADLVVYYFGGSTGGVRANIERWIGQFYDKDRTVELSTGKCRDGSYVLADISGTWKKPDGPPMARKTIDQPGSRVIGVILTTEKEQTKDWYFLKLSGPDHLVKSQSSALLEAFGAEASRPFTLQDSED